MRRRGRQRDETRFRDRQEAGQRLSDLLGHLADEEPVVLALPRGGVPVGVEVAGRLGAPLDVLVVRKIGLPRQPELGVGALGEGGARVLNRVLLDDLRLDEEDLADVVTAETAEVERRVARYRGDRPAVDVAGRTVVVVDDGIATGSTVRAAVQVLRARDVARVVVAVPVAPAATVEDLRGVADEVVCVGTPSPFRAIGLFYDDFRQVSDAEVLACLASVTGEPEDADTPGMHVDVELDDTSLPGLVRMPTEAVGMAVLVTAGLAERLRGRSMGTALRAVGIATLDLDLAPEAIGEEAEVPDEVILEGRLRDVVDWVHDRPALAGLPVALFADPPVAAAARRVAHDRGLQALLLSSEGDADTAAADVRRRLAADEVNDG